MPPTPPPKPDQTINHPAHQLLQKAHHSTSKSNTIFTDKIKNKPLLLHPSTTTTTTTTSSSSPSLINSRARRRKIQHQKSLYHHQHQKHKSTHPLSAREKRQLKTHYYPLTKPHETQYKTYLGLNQLWIGYFHELMGFTRDGRITLSSENQNRLVRGNEQGSLIASADFHGMEVEIVRCRDVGVVGLKGIVVRETKGTLMVVTKGDRVRRVLKDGAVFRVVVEVPGEKSTEEEEGVGGDGVGGGGGEKESKEQEASSSKTRKVVFDLIGSQLLVRPVDRATKKFKWHMVN